MNILGISAYYHDSAAALLQNGKVVAAAQEERFSRIKQDSSFPKQAVAFCLQAGGITIDEVDTVVYYDKPGLTFSRLMATFFTIAPKGLSMWLKAMPIWLKTKLHMKSLLRKELGYRGELLFTEHHESHGASAFFPSPFEEAAILTIDGVGEWATSSIAEGQGNSMKILKEMHFPDSLGMLYSAFTDFIGFRVNSGEYKLMGLAPYGKPLYKEIIMEKLLDLRDDGSLRLNMEYFDFIYGTGMTNSRLEDLLDGPKRKPESEITQRYMDIAASIQAVTEEVVLRMARFAHGETGMKNLCLAGGVALNCVANGRLLREGPFENVWIQPAAGDAGGALGAALSVWHQYHKASRQVENGANSFSVYQGPHFDSFEIEETLHSCGASFTEFSSDELPAQVAKEIANGQIVGFFSGKMEFGPRALGARSIIGDPRDPKTQEVMNLKIKYRESFRPFAPSVLGDRCEEYFDMSAESPYMLLVSDVVKDRCVPQQYGSDMDILERIKQPRSDIPAVTHMNYSARIHTVKESVHPQYYRVIKEFDTLTGCPVVVNTSFNIRGEPIVCTPHDAWRCFMGTEMDVLVLENYVLYKRDQRELTEDEKSSYSFKLD